MRDEITCPFLNVNGATVEVWEWISNFIPPFTVHVSAEAPKMKSRVVWWRWMFIYEARTHNAHCDASHNGEHSMVKLQTKTKQNQTKHKLQQQTHKYHTGVTDELSIKL